MTISDPVVSLLTREALLDIHARLLRALGPQEWWPGESPFEVMVGAILTQNTNWGNVERAIANLKAAEMLDPHALAGCNSTRLATRTGMNLRLNSPDFAADVPGALHCFFRTISQTTLGNFNTEAV